MPLCLKFVAPHFRFLLSLKRHWTQTLNQITKNVHFLPKNICQINCHVFPPPSRKSIFIRESGLYCAHFFCIFLWTGSPGKRKKKLWTFWCCSFFLPPERGRIPSLKTQLDFLAKNKMGGGPSYFFLEIVSFMFAFLRPFWRNIVKNQIGNGITDNWVTLLLRAQSLINIIPGLFFVLSLSLPSHI